MLLFLFLIVELYPLFSALITQNFNHNAELTKPIGTSINDAKAQIETHPVTAEISLKYCSM